MGLQSPFINWTAISGDREAGFVEQKVLIIGQGAGTAVAGEIVKEVTVAEAGTLFGENSMVTMAVQRFREHNEVVDISVLPLHLQGAGTKAQGGIKFTGTAEETKDIIVRVADDNFKVKLSVAKGETATQIASKIHTAIDASTIPVTSTVDSTDDTLVVLEFDIEGAVGNGLVTTQDERIAGVSVSNIVFSGGTGAYTTEKILDGISERYQTIIFDEAMMYEDVEKYVEGKFNTTNAVQGGVGITVKNGTQATVGAFVDGKNAKTMVVLGNVDEMKYNMIPLLAGAEFGAKRSLRMTDGAVLGDLVLDAEEVYGGIEKASLPYHNTPMSYRAPKSTIEHGELENLNGKGVSLIVPNGQDSVLGSLVTTYKHDNAGQLDANFKYLNAVDTAMAVQEYLYNQSKKEFGQTRATKGSLVAGVSMTNEILVKGFIVSLYEAMAEKALVQGGKEAIDYFKRELSVKLDITTGVYKVYAPTAIVAQFRGLDGTVAIGYNFKG